MSTTKPSYYSNNGKDLLDRFEGGLMTAEQVRGFYKGNIIKYVTRYQDKNGTEDLQKARTYLDRLIKFEGPKHDEMGNTILSKSDSDRVMKKMVENGSKHDKTKLEATAKDEGQKLFDAWKDVLKDWDKLGDQS